jgi:hypothetical protein
LVRLECYGIRIEPKAANVRLVRSWIELTDQPDSYMLLMDNDPQHLDRLCNGQTLYQRLCDGLPGGAKDSGTKKASSKSLRKSVQMQMAGGKFAAIKVVV